MKTTNVIKITAVLLFTVLSFGCGYGSQQTMPPTAGVVPAISQLAPSSMNSGGPAFVLTVNGSNFSGDAAVSWNGTAQTTRFVTASQLTINVPASAIAAPGTVAVTVTNPAVAGTGPYGGGTMAETSSPMNFTIN